MTKQNWKKRSSACSPRKQLTDTSPLLIVFAAASLFCLHTEGQSLLQDASLSGLNEFRFAKGFDITDNDQKPWNYLTNTTDVRAGLRSMYLKIRFDVQEPSMGFNPLEPVYREYFSRRTLGFELTPLLIEVGHVSTQFGRGLTFSCKEDREIERYSILDGVFGQMQNQWVTLQGVAGRPYSQRNDPVAILASHGFEEPETILLQNQADLHNRDIIAGGYMDVFLPLENLPFSFPASGSVGGGIVKYNANVDRLSFDIIDEDLFYYQERSSYYLPSEALNLTLGNYSLSVENALMTGRIHSYASDSLRGAFDSLHTPPNGHATYISVQGLVHNVALLAEYKNYDYEKTWYLEDHATIENISAFLIPPNVRYQHTWQLLNKHLLSNLMGNSIGYNFTAGWSPFENAQLTAVFSYGGLHETDSRCKINPDYYYWEAYGEWAQEAGDLLDLKFGFDYGKLDPEYPKVTYRTLACKVDAGPFRQRHSFGVTLEGQLNSKPFLAEENEQALKDLIVRVLPEESLRDVDDTLDLDLLVDDSERSEYKQYAFNMLGILSYSLSPWLTIAVTLEHEVKLEKQDYIHIVSDISAEVHNYASFGINLKPFSNHILKLEYGSMSGGKKCTLGTCVDMPSFKGFRAMLTSMF